MPLLQLYPSKCRSLGAGPTNFFCMYKNKNYGFIKQNTEVEKKKKR
jgi:hypothetical protein